MRVLAVPNAALRTQRDVASAASVLGREMAVVEEQLASARRPGADQRRSTMGGATTNGNGAEAEHTITFRGQTVELLQGHLCPTHHPPP